MSKRQSAVDVSDATFHNVMDESAALEDSNNLPVLGSHCKEVTGDFEAPLSRMTTAEADGLAATEAGSAFQTRMAPLRQPTARSLALNGRQARAETPRWRLYLRMGFTPRLSLT